MPHAGTWIEMDSGPEGMGGSPSCLTQARGLKWEQTEKERWARESCLTQARGLKWGTLWQVHRHLVVPHAGTWIEI